MFDKLFIIIFKDMEIHYQVIYEELFEGNFLNTLLKNTIY